MTMEFPDLGENCQLSNCKTLDFLPFTCNYCRQVFCKHHFLAEAHQCASVIVPSNPSEQPSGPRNFTCSSVGCLTTDVVAMLCVKCRSHFCLNHRYHSCFDNSEEELAEARKQLSIQKEKVAETFKKVSDQIDEKIETTKKTGKHAATAAKVQLMRLKGKAKGEKNIPETSRVYFLVYPPKQLASQSKPVYVSNEWSIGRVIDSISSLVDAVNRNNQAHSSKLRLFKKSDGGQVSSEMSEKLSELLKSGNINNGESVILEYVKPEEPLKEFRISSPSEYL